MLVLVLFVLTGNWWQVMYMIGEMYQKHVEKLYWEYYTVSGYDEM